MGDIRKLTDEQIAELESEDSFLRGYQALAILNEAVKETGAIVPRDYVFRDMNKGVVKKAFDATFELIGGVPAMMAWAAMNPDSFYKTWAKFGTGEGAVLSAGQVNLISNLPGSPLDNRSIDAMGRVTTLQADDEDV